MSQLWELSAREIRDKVAAGDLRASEVVQASLARIEAVNPAVNAIVEVFPEEAIVAAELLDARIARGDEPGLLAGVPVTIKDNIDCTGHANTNGLRIQKDNVVDQDSPVVTNLRRAGAIILGPAESAVITPADPLAGLGEVY